MIFYHTNITLFTSQEVLQMIQVLQMIYEKIFETQILDKCHLIRIKTLSYFLLKLCTHSRKYKFAH